MDKVEQLIFELLPNDGTPVPNHILKLQIGRRLGTDVDREYNAARERLQKDRRVGYSRGAAGKIFLISAPPSDLTTSPVRDTLSEADLMPRLMTYLQGRFLEQLDLLNASFVVQDVSRIGPHIGQWVRPDFVLVSVSRLSLLSQRLVDVHTFELKAESGASVQAVHEALAQTRFSHFGHLVWHLPRGSQNVRETEIEEHCKLHGIGLIFIRDPEDTASFEIRLAPSRKATPLLEIEGFLTSRLSDGNKEKLQSALGSQ